MDWPRVELREVMSLDLDSVRVDPAETYDMVGVYSFGKGLFRREPVSGANTSYRVFYRLKPDHIVMSQLFGWEGALALSSREFAGRYVSPQFPTFLCNLEKLDRGFFGWFIRTPSFWDDLSRRTRGMGDRRRTLNPEALLSSVIPLPVLDEQQRIVRRVDDMAKKLEEARRLRKENLEASGAFITSLHNQLSGSRMVSLRDILRLDERRVAVQAGTGYPQVGIKGFGEGLFARGPVDGAETTYREFNLLFDGALVLSQVKGWEGAIAVCGREFAGLYASPEYRTFSFIPAQAIPEYMSAIVPTYWFYSKLADLTRGVGARRERTRPEAFLDLKVPMPTIEQQRHALQIFDKLNPLNLLQSKTATELDALMPSILSKSFRGEL
jgi:type I restriction enzyme, S subunit